MHSYVTINITESQALLDNTEPVFAQSDYVFDVPVDSTDGMVIGSVLATDADQDIVGYSTDDWMFSVNSSGDVILEYADDLQYYGVGETYSLSVTASDGLVETQTYVTINITSAEGSSGNSAPVFEDLDYAFDVPVDSAEGFFIGTVLATDINQQTVSYSTDDEIFYVNDDGELILEENDLSSTGVGQSYSFSVVASDGEQQTWVDVTIYVTESETAPSNNAPVFEENVYTFDVASNATDGTILGTVIATDDDADGLSYWLDSDSTFFVDDSGQLAVNDSVQLQERGAGEIHTLTVTAFDGTDTADTTVIVTILPGDSTADDQLPIDPEDLERERVQSGY